MNTDVSRGSTMKLHTLRKFIIMKYRQFRFWIFVIGIFAIAPPSVQSQENNVIMSHHGYGIGGFSLFEPDIPTPSIAPFVMFLPGWSVTNPDNYGALLDHLVKTGHVVAMVFYMNDSNTPTPTFTDNVMKGLRNALDELANPGHVQPDMSHFSIIGHSAGALEAVNYAIVASDYDMPNAGLLFGITPGTSQVARKWNWLPCQMYRYGGIPIFPDDILNTDPNWNQEAPFQRMNSCMMLRNVTRIPSLTYMVMVGGDRDGFARNDDALSILEGATQVPVERRIFYCMNTKIQLNDKNRLDIELANHYFASSLDMDYNNNSPQGITLFGVNSRRVARVTERQNRRMEMHQQQVVNTLDNELWSLFDQAEQVAFDGNSWTLPVTHVDQLSGTIGRLPLCSKP